MYPKNLEGTREIVESMNVGYDIILYPALLSTNQNFQRCVPVDIDATVQPYKIQNVLIV